ncbi:hypothetical protein FOL47_010197 [Perkinsus chesapeaki]|uniref:Cyclic phosphodiesterase n=1 Tax=Perkinsus chesapeaki TaxID=330153 RepID=A0A7J6MQP3_PERCH|nr:hypothetical protein FOL47_010197 [Perkinsus chesapeaki]
MSKGIHYSVWVSPPPSSEIYQEISELITKAHTMNPHMTDAIFQPHITIVGSFMADSDEDAITKAKKYSQKVTTGGFTVEFDAVPSAVEADKWNMAVVYWIDDHNGDLLALHQAFGAHTTDYTPHISLCYGNCSKSERVEIAKRMKESTTLEGRCYFHINSVELWKTEGGLDGVNGWSKITTISL